MVNLLILTVFWLASPGASPSGVGAIDSWHQWRGPEMTGVAPKSNPPVEWSEDKNIKWKTEIPGNGHSTPIVTSDLVILQTAIPSNSPKEAASAAKPEAKAEGGQPAPRDGEAREGRERRRDGERRERRGEGPRGERGPGGGRERNREAPTESYKFTVLALDRHTGKPVWERTVREQVPHEGSHGDGSLAPASPVTDGEQIFAFFGSRGLYCLTMKGEVVWEKDLGDMKTRSGFGEGNSPALHGDTLVVNWDHEGDDFIVALDKKTGQEKWRRERDEPTSWSTPLIAEDGKRTQVIVSADNLIRSYDISTGETIWECAGLGANAIPTPVANSNLVFAMTGFRDPALLAIRFREAKGDVSESASVAWKTNDGTSYVPSPLLYGDSLYYVQKNTGILSGIDAETGKPHFEPQRLDGFTGVYASPVGANNRVYVVGRNGVTKVLKHGKSFEVLATNNLDDDFSASPAIAGNELFLRGHKRVYCIAAP